MNVRQVNNLNIGLMLLSAAAAFVVPFELFLVSYAVLGPLHYLTELSWLHDRKYFASRWTEVGGILGLALLAVLITGYFHGLAGVEPDAVSVKLSHWGAEIALVALGVAWIAGTKFRTTTRMIGVAVVLGIAAGAHYVDRSPGIPYYDVVLEVYLATIIHVFVFTGAFLLYGSLKEESRSGYVSCVVFVACAVACVYAPSGGGYSLSEENVAVYRMTSLALLHTLADHLPLIDHARIDTDPAKTFLAAEAVQVGRFIAFAYTYHYLNWFSKTSVIRWHEVPPIRFVGVIVLWILALVLYAIDFRQGLMALFGLSLLHVYMEFPLNCRCFAGIAQELRRRL